MYVEFCNALSVSANEPIINGGIPTVIYAYSTPTVITVTEPAAACGGAGDG